MKKKRRKTRKKRAGSSWLTQTAKCAAVLRRLRTRDPMGAEETKCCCNTYSCRNNSPGLCPSLFGKVGQAIKDKYEDWSEKAREQSNEKKDEKKEKVFKYHTNRKKNQGEKEGSYGSPCKNQDGELWGQVKPRLGTKLFMGGPGIPCEGSDRTCKLAENNPSGVPIQHYTNWLAPAKAFEQPPAEYMPGKIDNEGLACRPDAGLDLWGHPHADRKSFEGKGEWCRLDPVRRGFKSNKSKSNRQTCLTAANKNLFASSLSAKDAGRYFMDEDGLKKKLKDIWTETERIKKEATKKFAADYKKKLVADKKKLVADKVQAQAHAFGEKQKGNNAEFFNAQSGNEFFDAQSGGRRRKRRKKKTRRRRNRRRRAGRRKKRTRRRRGGNGWITVSEAITEAEEEAQVVEGEHWSMPRWRRERRGREQAKLLTNELSGKLVRITIYGRPEWNSMDRQVVGTIKEAKVYISTTDIFLWFDGDSTWSGKYAEPDEVTILTQPGPTMDHFGDMVTHPTAIVPLPVKIEVKKPPKSARKGARKGLHRKSSPLKKSTYLPITMVGGRQKKRTKRRTRRK